MAAICEPFVRQESFNKCASLQRQRRDVSSGAKLLPVAIGSNRSANLNGQIDAALGRKKHFRVLLVLSASGSKFIFIDFLINFFGVDPFRFPTVSHFVETFTCKITIFLLPNIFIYDIIIYCHSNLVFGHFLAKAPT